MPDRILSIARRLELRNRLVIRLYSEDMDVPSSATWWDVAWRTVVAWAPEEVPSLVGRLRGVGKYAVYRPLLMNPQPVEPGTGDYLERLERQLRAGGIAVLNLTPVFEAAAARSLDRGEYLYWLDDIHWNARGIALAAATIQQRWRLTDASCRTSRPLVVETSHDQSQR